METSARINVSVQNVTLPDSTYKTVILKPNMVGDVNTLTQAMMNQTNTKYVIKYDYTLASDVTVPSGCVLEFDGGDIDSNNHSLSLADDTIVINVKGSVCTTANRPTLVSVGYQSFDTTLGKPTWFDGENWVDATGAIVYGNVEGNIWIGPGANYSDVYEDDDYLYKDINANNPLNIECNGDYIFIIYPKTPEFDFNLIMSGFPIPTLPIDTTTLQDYNIIQTANTYNGEFNITI